MAAPTLGIFEDEGQRIPTTIPTGSVVTVVAGEDRDQLLDLGEAVVELLELAVRSRHRRGRRKPFRQCPRIRKVVHVPLRKRGQLII